MITFTFSFDDGYRSWVDAGALLSSYEYKGVFNTVLRNVVHRRASDRPRMFPEKAVITWAELTELQRRGHEITSHGVRHVNLSLCNLEELDLEILGSAAVFKSKGINASSYTCAFNVWNKRALEMSKSAYSSFRVSTGVNEIPLKDRTYRAMCASNVLDYIRENRDKDEWVVGVWHDVNLKTFVEKVKKVKDMGLTVKTVKEMIS